MKDLSLSPISTTRSTLLDTGDVVGYPGRTMANVDPFASATELLTALRAGRVTSGELTELYIRRIERYDGQLNAVVVRDFERARERARAADAPGPPGALLGLPVTIKESFNVAGLETTC